MLTRDREDLLGEITLLGGLDSLTAKESDICENVDGDVEIADNVYELNCGGGGGGVVASCGVTSSVDSNTGAVVVCGRDGVETKERETL